jgi:hypothetical protein
MIKILVVLAILLVDPFIFAEPDACYYTVQQSGA